MSGGIQEFLTPTHASNPLDIVAGRDSRMYFVEYDASTLGVTDSTGHISEIALPTANAGPADLTLAPDGSIWFSEFLVGKIGRLNVDGTVSEFTVTTAGSGPNGIAADGAGNIWFAESYANKIGRYNVGDGTFSEFALPTGGATPIDIVLGDDGNLWFTEWAGQIGRITPDGVVTEFGGLTGDANPAGIVAGPDGNIYFTEYGTSQIGRIGYDGSSLTEFSVPTANSVPYAITAGPDGNVYFSESNTNKIASLAPDGTFIEYAITTAGSTPTGIAASTDGASIWFTESGASQIGRLNLDLTVHVSGDQNSVEDDGVAVQTYATGGGGSSLYTYSATGLPDGVLIDPHSGNISGFLALTDAETNGGVYQVTVTATDSIASTSASFTWTVIDLPLTLSGPSDQANGEGDSIYVIEATTAGGDSSAYTYSASGLPSGLSVDSTTGAIGGTIDFGAAQASNGDYTVNVFASDGVTTVSQTFTWTVTRQPLKLANPEDQINAVGDANYLALSAGGGDNGNYTFTVSGPFGLPSGLTLDSQTGIIAGIITPEALQTNGGIYPVEVTVSDGVNQVSQSFNYFVAQAVAAKETPLTAVVSANSSGNFMDDGHRIRWAEKGDNYVTKKEINAAIAWGEKQPLAKNDPKEATGGGAAALATLTLYYDGLKQTLGAGFFKDGLGPKEIAEYVRLYNMDITKVNPAGPDFAKVRYVQNVEKDFEYRKAKLADATRELAPGTKPVVANDQRKVYELLTVARDSTKVQQGVAGDCVLLATTIGMINTRAGKNDVIIRETKVAGSNSPQYSVQFIRYKGDGGNEYKLPHITDSEIALYSTAGKNGLWLSVLERAYTKVRQSENGLFSNVINGTFFQEASYKQLSGQYPNEAIYWLTGNKSVNLRADATKDAEKLTADNVQSALAAVIDKTRKDKDGFSALKVVAVVGSKPNADYAKDPSSTLPPAHAFTVLAFNAATEELRLQNPWNDSGRKLYGTIFAISMADFIKLFGMISVEIRP